MFLISKHIQNNQSSFQSFIRAVLILYIMKILNISIFKKIAISLIVLVVLWFSASFYLLTQAQQVIYDEEYSKYLDFSNSYQKATVKNSSNENLDLLIGEKSETKNYFLYLHGTWGRLPYIVDGLTEYGSVYSIAYPGFSDSQGSSSTDKVNESAELALKYMNDKGIKNEQITVLGHSLGGSPALYLSAKHENLNKVVIINTFYSMKAMCEKQYSILCIFAGGVHPSIDYAKQAKAPIVHLHSPTDEFIPFKQGCELEQNIASKNHSFHQIKGTHGEFNVDEVMKKSELNK
jgi:dienelactone hydrolase